ncbi:acyl-CoA dehydrogenase family protein [Microvirga sp. W0021]|uniref:Acyl-CoA dehydrogenase family protein n=1 Tax=Hohaiivirga grylli TaxID=3133970 RepID=A0ABV0BHP9_9HYPH
MLAPSQDQFAIQSMARQFADERIAPFALEWDEKKYFPTDTLKEAATLGMAAIYVREDVGGSGMGRLDAALIFEALATGCPTIAAFLSIHNMVAWMIDAYGSEEQRQTYLPGLASMEQIASYCLTEPSAGSDAAALKTKATHSGSQYILNGTKQFISGAGASDLYLVMARTGDEGPDGISAFLIPKDAKGLSFGINERKMGWNAQPTRQVILEDVTIPEDNRLGAEGLGFKMAMAGLNGGRLNIGACSIGGGQSALEKTLAYMAERQAFGQKLDSFQALQFQLAAMASKLEAARTFLWRAADALDHKTEDAIKLCAIAKYLATDTGFEVANNALQLHGGYGYLADYGIEKIVRDLRVHQILEGTNEIMQLMISRFLIKEHQK